MNENCYNYSQKQIMYYITFIYIYHGSKGIRQWMAGELIYIPNNDAQNYPFCRL